MKHKSHRKIKRKPIIVLIGFIILLIAICKIFFSVNIKIENSYIEAGHNFEIKYSFFDKGKDVSDKVEMTNDIDVNKIGKYYVTFKYNNKEYKKSIKVLDKESPKIELNGGEEINVPLNSEYSELGYTVNDNYDKNLKPEITGKVDTSKEGIYELTYIVKDNSGNISSVIRRVRVSKNSPLEMSIKDFSLNGLFPNTILKETEDGGEGYIKDIVFVGDSVPLYYVISKHITGSQLWHKEGINIEAALVQNVYVNHIDSKRTFVQNFSKYKPKMAILNIGMNSAATMSVNYFITCYKKLLTQIKEASPETIIIVQSIPPVDSDLDSNEKGLNNKKINTFNYKLAELCDSVGIKFLNSSVVLKDENGQCKKGYCYLEKNNYGVHQTKIGNDEVFKYIRTHMAK